MIMPNMRPKMPPTIKALKAPDSAGKQVAAKKIPTIVKNTLEKSI
jgi:hypothetical protein